MQQNSLKSASFEAIRLNRLIVVSDRKEVIIMKSVSSQKFLFLILKLIVLICLISFCENLY